MSDPYPIVEVQPEWVLVYRTAEIESIVRNAARVVVIRARDKTGLDIAELLVKGRHRIARFLAKTPAPFVAAINRSSKVQAYPNIQDWICAQVPVNPGHGDL